MTAEIISLWLHRNGARTHTAEQLGFIGKARPATYEQLAKLCMHEPRTAKAVIDVNCPCAGCREFFGQLEQPINL